MNKEPKTLQEAIVYFSNKDNCRDYLVARRWPNGVTCPTCGSESVTAQPKYNRWQCASHHDRRQFTLKTGTIFEDSPIGLDKWLAVMWMVVNCKNGISSYEIHRAIGVTQKSAWFMSHRVRLALGMESSEKLGGTIEADETVIGGASRFRHFGKRKAGYEGKVLVMGMLERHGEVRARVIPDPQTATIQREVRKHVELGSELMTDAYTAYPGLNGEYIHAFVNHTETYVRGRVHTNGIENFWSLLKRGLKGTYVSVEPFHLFRYLDEQSFRFNNRTLTDSQRFDIASRAIIGKRLTFAQVTGKDNSRQPASH